MSTNISYTVCSLHKSFNVSKIGEDYLFLIILLL